MNNLLAFILGKIDSINDSHTDTIHKILNSTAKNIDSTNELNTIIQSVQTFYESTWNTVIVIITLVIVLIPIVNIAIQTWFIKKMINDESSKTRLEIDNKIKQLEEDYKEKIKNIEILNQESTQKLNKKINISISILKAELALAKAENNTYGPVFTIRNGLVAIDFFRVAEQIDKCKQTIRNVINYMNYIVENNTTIDDENYKFITEKIDKFIKDNYDKEYSDLIFELKSVFVKYKK
jgi:hypothetical protein